jgi:hypothetical protein
MNIPRSIILTSSFLIILLWSTVANEGLFALSTEIVPDNGVNHALIIGIGSYDEWAKLDSPPKDAKEIARILTEKYNFKAENITLLTDDTKEKPTLVNIVSALDRYVSRLTDKDNLLIFYSGHSADDEEEETYWIPKDANKKLKVTWLKHSDICKEYLANEKFKAKNVAVITDSLFSKTLLKPTSIALSPYDLRYTEKIREQAQKTSREVISFGDKHWPGSQKTEGYGLFTYYFRKALMDNWFKVIDLENLIFEEDTIFQVRQVAGTRLVRGRLKNCIMEKGGQTIITRLVSPPAINVTTAYVNPKKGYAGDNFIVEAVTSRSASEVYVELGGKKYLMDGEGTEWKHSIKVANVGTSSFKVLAINEDDVEGESKKGEITTLTPLTGMVSVSTASVSPRKGQGGDEFSFTAKTDASAKKVALIIGDKRYEMTGSGTDWSLKQKVDETGSVTFSIVAVNDAGVEGRPKGDIISIKAPEINIVKVQTEPAKGYAGDDFLITAGTNTPALSVTLQLDGATYEMEGTGKEWKLKRRIADIGKKQFTVIAKNMDGIAGGSKIGEIVTSEKPPGIPDVTTVALSPAKVRVGETFVINVKTASDAKEVSIELEGKRQPMEGAGTEWKYSTRIASLGTTGYKVIARNKDGVEGKAKEGKITTTEKVGIDMVQVDVSPKEGNMGEVFTFNATTGSAAKSVTAVIKDKRYNMSGSGTNWSLKKEIEDFGTIDFYVIASDDKGVEGSSMGASFKTKAILANVIDASYTSGKGYAGEEFTIIANTDNPAKSVSLDIDGVTYEMEGSGKKWQYKKRILDVGKKQFVVKAKNIEGAAGSTKSGTIVAKLAVPDVATVSFSPDKVYAGEDFIIKAQTTAAADQVLIEIAGKSQPMEGAGTDWSLQTKLASVGTSQYKVTAKNVEGTQGLPKQGNIVTAKKAGALINIATAAVSPDKGYAGGTFTFKASTDSPAKGVTLTIGGKDYEMTGSGTSWTLAQKIQKTGELVFSMAAVNEDKVEGIAKPGSLTVSEIMDRFTYNEDGTVTDKVSGEVKKRFVDNGDGTVTDISTNLMWTQSPKRVAVSYEEAEDYCRELTVRQLTGWRLPTAQEWQDIIDKTQEAPALPKGHPFKNIVFSVFFWSKTRHTTLTQRIYVADLYTGKIGAQGKDNQYIAWPVRYAEAGVQ